MTHSEPTPIPLSERTPHPKRLSREAAKRLHDGGQLPDSEGLRDASGFDPEKHINNDEIRIQKKPEVYAIQAHLIAELAKVVLRGEGENIRFAIPIEEDYTAVTGISKLTQELVKTGVSYEMKLAKIKVLESPNNRLAFDRLKELQGREELTGIFQSDIIRGTIKLIQMINTQSEIQGLNLTPEQKRRTVLDSIDILEDIAELNDTHERRLFQNEYPDYDDEKYGKFTANFVEGVLEKQQDGSYRLAITTPRNPKPKTGLFGATIGCPAGFHLEEGESALRKVAIAIVNEAYDRGLFEPALQQYESERQ